MRSHPLVAAVLFGGASCAGSSAATLDRAPGAGVEPRALNEMMEEEASQPSIESSPAPEPDAAELREIATQEANAPGERIGEAALAGTAAGDACRAACAVSYAALCLRVTQICAAAEFVTLGGVTLPCATAVTTVCLSTVAIGSLCRDRCPP